MRLRDKFIDIGVEVSLSVPSGESLPPVFLGAWPKLIDAQSEEGWLMLTQALQMDRNLLSRALRLLFRSRIIQRSLQFTTPLTDISESIYLLDCIAKSPEETRKLTVEDLTVIEKLIGHLISHLHYFVLMIINTVRSKYEDAIKKWWLNFVTSKFDSSSMPSPTTPSPIVLSDSEYASKQFKILTIEEDATKSPEDQSRSAFPPGPPLPPAFNSKRLESLIPNPKPLRWTQSVSYLHQAATELWFILDKLIPRSQLVRSTEGQLKFRMPSAATYPRLERDGHFYDRPSADEELDESKLPPALRPPPVPLEVPTTWNTLNGLSHLREKAQAAYPDLKIDFETGPVANRILAVTKQVYQSGDQIACDANTAWSGICPCLCNTSFLDLPEIGVLQSLAARYRMPELVLLPQLFNLNGPTSPHQWLLMAAVHWADARKVNEKGLGDKKGGRLHFDPLFPLATYSEIWKQFPMRNAVDFHSFLDMLTVVRSNAIPMRLKQHPLPISKLSHTHKVHCPMAHSWNYIYVSSIPMLLKPTTRPSEVNVRIVPKTFDTLLQKSNLTVEATTNIPAGSMLFFNPEDIPGYDWCSSCGDSRPHQKCVFLPHTVPLQPKSTPFV